MAIRYKPRFAVLAASISAVLALSACQPTVEDTVETEAVVPAEAVATDTAAMDPHAGHDMTGNAMSDSAMMQVDGAPMTEMHKDYTTSMTAMHEEMMKGTAHNDPDNAFAQGMLGHHIGAVAMAQTELKYGTDAEMRKLAQEIIDAQQSEITTMKTWLASNPDASSPTPNTKAMQQAYAQGMDAMHGEMMLGIADPIPDMAFARGMLPHHAGAVDMAKVQLKYGKDAEMLKLAQQVIDAQELEIEQMKKWISANGGTMPSV